MIPNKVARSFMTDNKSKPSNGVILYMFARADPGFFLGGAQRAGGQKNQQLLIYVPPCQPALVCCY